jgi:2-(1,2-epoxy-1,2-dihydrophenyl)acetyl-CoA isomerase
MAKMKQPIIAAVNGVAAGAGANLALGADLTIMGKQAVMTQAFVRIGLLPDAGGTWFLPRRVGLQKALGLAMTGDKITGEDAERMGLIWKAVEDTTLMVEAQKLATHLAALPANALAEMKQAIHAAFTNTLDQQLDLERDAQTRLGKTKDFKEGISAFLEKRPAQFTGE